MVFFTRISAAVLISVVLLFGPTEVQAAKSPPIQEMLDKPDTRLLAVEFYADWCEPCKKAVPKWRKLMKKYHKRGLRLLVIKTQAEENKANCSLLKWQPDAEYCDSEGEWLERFSGKMEIPSGFLWTWQGKLLVQDESRIENIEKEVKRYFDGSYRIQDIYVSGTDEPNAIRKALRVAVQETGKFDVLASRKQAEELSKIRKESHKPQYDDEQRCALGEALSGNASIDASVEEGSLYVELLDAEKACVAASTRTFFNPKKPWIAAKKSLADLLKILKSSYQRPVPGVVPSRVTGGTISRRQFSVDMGEKIKNSITDDEGFLTVTTQPEGADIYINGEPKGSGTWQDSLPVGKYVVVAKKGRRYYPGRQEVKIDSKGAEINFKLIPAFGTLSVQSSPMGAEVWIDDQLKGVTPLNLPQMLAERYPYEIRMAHFHPVKGVVDVKDNRQTTRLDVALKPNSGDLFVTSKPEGANVYFDGRKVGTTPYKQKNIRAGVYPLRVETEHHLGFSEEIKIREGVETRRDLSLKPNFGTLNITTNPLAAEIVLNGEEMLASTPATFEKLKPGKHTVELIKPGYGQVVKIVRVENQQITPLNVDLPAKLGRVTILTKTEDNKPCKAKVFMDGKLVGSTPWKKDVLAVKHTFRLECLEGKARETVVVKHNEKQTLKVTVVGGPAGKITVTTHDLSQDKPLPSKVVIDGHELGSAPAHHNVAAGTHHVWAELPGYEPFSKRIEVKANQRLRLSLGLESTAEVDARTIRKWTAAGTTLAGMVAGTVFSVMQGKASATADTEYAAYQNANNPQDAALIYERVEDARSQSSTFQAVGLGSFGLAVGAGIWTLIEWTLPWAPESRVTFSPVMSGVSGVQLHGEF